MTNAKRHQSTGQAALSSSSSKASGGCSFAGVRHLKKNIIIINIITEKTCSCGSLSGHGSCPGQPGAVVVQLQRSVLRVTGCQLGAGDR